MSKHEDYQVPECLIIGHLDITAISQDGHPVVLVVPGGFVELSQFTVFHHNQALKAVTKIKTFKFWALP